MAVGGADLSDLIRPAKEMTKHMTLGQCAKYSSNEQDNKIYCAKTGKMLYDCNTGESF